MTDTFIREIQALKNQLYNQQQDISILNKKIDQLLEEIDYRDINKNVNLI